MSASRVIQAIKKYSNFLITAHIDLEADALGSELALASLLRKLGKRALIVNAGRTPAVYRFLPGVKTIRHHLAGCRAEAAFIIDCSNKSRSGYIADLINKDLPIINIDHHIGNKNFGRINWVDSSASSTGEMIYELFRLFKTKLDKNDALNIYAAILTDTGSFRHSNTSSRTHHICSQLLRLGIRPAKIYTQIYENNSLQDMKLLLEVLSRIQLVAGGRIARIKISRPTFKRLKAKPAILDRILDFAKSIGSVKVVLIFSQKGVRLVKLSLRSKSPVDVQRLAQSFGGGGHRFASGCTIKGSFKDIEKRVLKQLKKALNTKD
jgi:phosphoesterase RecJ-like protein